MSLSLASAIIGGVTALGGAAYGGIASGKYNRKAENLIQNQRNKNQDWWNVKRSEDFTQRADVQSAVTRQRELLNEQYKRAKATNTVAGGTDESLALQKRAANAALSQTTSDIAASANRHKDVAEARYLATDGALNQQQVVGNQQMAKSAAAAGAQLVNSGVNTLGYGVSEYVKERELKKVADDSSTPPSD